MQFYKFGCTSLRTVPDNEMKSRGGDSLKVSWSGRILGNSLDLKKIGKR